MYSGVLPCGSTAARYINSQTCTRSFKDGKGNLKDVAVCVCPLQAVPSVPCPSSFNSPAFNGLRRALQPNHRPASFRLTEYNKDSGGKWHLWTCCLTTAETSGWAGLLVVGFLLFASFIRCVCEGEWQKSGSWCVCFPVSCVPAPGNRFAVLKPYEHFSPCFSKKYIKHADKWCVCGALCTVLTCDPREPLLWSQSERGSICGKQRQRHVETTVLHILFLLASHHFASTRRPHRNGDILREKRRSGSGDAKTRGRVCVSGGEWKRS